MVLSELGGSAEGAWWWGSGAPWFDWPVGVRLSWNAEDSTFGSSVEPKLGGSVTGPDPSVLRAGIVELLELLGDAAAQERYEDGVPLADVPSELQCMWFDDSYIPDSPAFQAAFTVAELAALAEFNHFYDSRAGALPSGGGVRALHRSTAWAEIMAAATAVRARIV